MSSLQDWQEANQRYLIAELAVLKRRLYGFIKANGDVKFGLEDGEKEKEKEEFEKKMAEAVRIRDEAARSLPSPGALECIAKIFRLTAFERDLLLFCAGPELDSDFASLCSEISDSSRPGGSRLPTFALAMHVLPGAHWSAFTPTGPLRRWHMIEVGDGDALTCRPLKIDEKVLHYLLGVDIRDERLDSLQLADLPGDLPDSYLDLARQIEEAMQRPDRPIIELLGADSEAKQDVAAFACSQIGLLVYAISSEDIPLLSADRDKFVRLWVREAFLSGAALLVDCEDLEGRERTHAALSLIERLESRVLVASREPLLLKRRAGLCLEVAGLAPAERRLIWKKALGPLAEELDGQLEMLVDQFNLGQKEILAASAQAEVFCLSSGQSDQSPRRPGERLWDACRAQTRPRLEELAQRIEPAATWDDLVLPESLQQVLREIGVHLRQSSRVYGSWGFGSKG
ncbi:MAG: hypothetical protein PHQ34_10985 [Methanothrix sp.]|nr:hypothetical protein [Methanothrix sp.]